MRKNIFCLFFALIPFLVKAQTPNTWVQRADVGTNFANSPVLREDAASFSVAGKGYICAGYDPYNSVPLNDLWEYDTLGNTWSQKANFPGGIRRGAVGM